MSAVDNMYGQSHGHHLPQPHFYFTALQEISQNWQDFLLVVDRQIYESCSLRSHGPGKYKFIEEQQQIYSELFMN